MRTAGGWEVQLEGEPAQVIEGDHAQVLADAQARGAVVRFGPQPLSDLFRDKVAPR